MAEKKALRRFLIIYVLSTVFLVGIGEWFYYKLAKEDILKKEKLVLRAEITQFLNENPFLMRSIRFSSFSVPKGMKVLIYHDNKLIFSNSPLLDVKLEHIEVKRWGKIKIIATAPFDSAELKSVLKKLMVFNLFFGVFLVLIAFFLGRIFLSPLKNVISNLEDFIRDATHEMNTPISIILTNIELLGDETKPIKRIKNAAFRLSRIFEDLKYIRLYHRRQKVLKKTDLEKFLNERMELFESLVEKKRLNVKLNSEKVFLEIDREDLIRLVDNLLSNAFKYAPLGSEVKIWLTKERFCIENRGEIKNLKEITKKFYRENSSEGGFGLGLYIVKKISEEYGFRLVLENKEENVISCLYFV